MTDAPPDSPLVISPGSKSAPLTLSILDNSAPDDPTDSLTAWQTTLQIVPGENAVGALSFDVTATPADYIFSTTNSAGIETRIQTNSTANDTLVAFDFNFPFTGGVQVPASPTSLLTMDFVASGDAAGRFGVFALNDSRQTIWTDASQPISLARDFINVPPSGPPILIGEILIQPEFTSLEAGDADRDFDFDQLDLIQVLRARKYLTGEGATWGEGDWNGAPGGSQQNPPLGDGLFDQFDLIAALRAQIYLSGSYAASTESIGQDDGLIGDSVVSQLTADMTPTNLDSVMNMAFASSEGGEDGLSMVINSEILTSHHFGLPRLQSSALHSAISGEVPAPDGNDNDVVNALLIPEPPAFVLLVGLIILFAGAFRTSPGEFMSSTRRF